MKDDRVDYKPSTHICFVSKRNELKREKEGDKTALL